MTAACKRSLDGAFLPPSQILKTIPTLPKDIWGMVFDYLPAYLDKGGDVRRWSHVCKMFKKIALDSSDAVSRIFGRGTPGDVSAFLKIYLLYEPPLVKIPEECEHLTCTDLAAENFQGKKIVHLDLVNYFFLSKDLKVIKAIEKIHHLVKLSLGWVHNDFLAELFKNPPPLIHFKCTLFNEGLLSTLSRPVHIILSFGVGEPINFSLLESLDQNPAVKNLTIERHKNFFGSFMLRLLILQRDKTIKIQLDDDEYHGESKYHIPHGQGSLYRNGEEIFSGQFVNGFPFNGKGVLERNNYTFFGIKEGFPARVVYPDKTVFDLRRPLNPLVGIEDERVK